ncbi:hypothetical protein U1Q18_023363 [Sarracenia purpurea var. burkii]
MSVLKPVDYSSPNIEQLIQRLRLCTLNSSHWINSTPQENNLRRRKPLPSSKTFFFSTVPVIYNVDEFVLCAACDHRALFGTSKLPLFSFDFTKRRNPNAYAEALLLLLQWFPLVISPGQIRSSQPRSTSSLALSSALKTPLKFL